MVKLTEKEIKAIKTFNDVNDEPEDDDGLNWCQPEDLISSGYTRHEAAGLFSSLMEKGIIQLYEPRSKCDGGDLFVYPYNIL